jgi:hypothetical protein
MKRAARFKTGSVVFDKRRKTWNFLWWENGKRRTTRIGTLAEYPSKSTARRAAQEIQLSHTDVPRTPANEAPKMKSLVERYRAERMPKRADTKRAYEVWIWRRKARPTSEGCSEASGNSLHGVGLSQENIAIRWNWCEFAKYLSERASPGI